MKNVLVVLLLLPMIAIGATLPQEEVSVPVPDEPPISQPAPKLQAEGYDLEALMKQKEQERMEACQKEIAAACDKYKCVITAETVLRDGQYPMTRVILVPVRSQ